MSHPELHRLESRTLFSTPTLSTANVAVTEGSGATATITVKLSKKRSSGEVKVTYTTKSSSAISGTNFIAQRGTIIIPAGKSSGSASISIVDDLALTTDEKFYVDFTSAVHALLPTTALYSRVTIEPGVVTPVDISDNLSEVSGGTQFSQGDTVLAASFRAPSASTFTSVTLPLEEASPGAAVVDIYGDNGSDQPGTLIGTLTSPSTYSSSALAEATFTSTSGITLTAGAVYWVALRASSDFNWSFTTSTTGDGSGFNGLWAYSTDGGSSWFTNNSSPLQMSVNVT